MDMKRIPVFSSLLITALLLVACGSKPAPPTAEGPTATGNTAVPSGPTVTPSATPDLCTQDQMADTVKIVNTYVYQFVNYSSLSIQVPPAQLPQMVASMKAIRQALQQQIVPPCLTDLKHYALQYMDAVIQTETTYMSQATPDKLAFEAGRQQALKYNDQYAIEMARLLGVTLAPQNATPAAQESSTPAGAVVFNPGPNPLNLHRAPSLTSESIGMLEANASAKAIGRSSNGEWIQVEVPGQPGARAWVYASLVQYTSGDASVLPVATP
jgi:hypothetical protein